MAELSQVYTKQYGAHVYRLAQQTMSALRPFVRVETMQGEKRHFDRVKPTSAIRIESKYSDTALIHTEFDRRTVHGLEYGWADMIDWQDNLNLLLDPASEVVAMGAAALARTLDDIIIAGAFIDAAWEGKEGLTQVNFPAAQKIPVTWGSEDGSNTGLSVSKILEVKSRFGKADIDTDDPANQVFMAVTQNQLDDLYRSVNISNRDYDVIRDLATGKTHELFGVRFVRTGRLPATDLDDEGRVRTCAAWVKSGVVLVIPKEIGMKISSRDDKWGNWQAMATMKAGATRLEDAKVVQVPCYEVA